MKTTFDYAKEYIDQGIYVFPLYKVIGGKCNCTDSECKHPGKHPKIGNWRNTASNKLEDIEIWFKNNEGSNIAILTGKKSNICVIDVDLKNGGLYSLELLEDKYGQLPQVPTVHTGGGGLHYFFKYSDLSIAKTTVNFLGYSGIDIRSEGAYVCAVPSIHQSGKTYEWEVSSDFQRSILQFFPSSLVNAIPLKSAKKNETNNVFREGQRNSGLASLAGTMRRRGMGHGTIEQALILENIERCFPPLDEKEVVAIAKSISRYEPSDAKTPDTTDNKDAEKWGVVIDFDEISSPPALSTEDLPRELANTIFEIAKHYNVPPELPYSLAIPILSTAIGASISVQMPTHKEVCSTWMCCVLPPGSRKSAVFSELLGPVVDLEHKAKQDWKANCIEWSFKRQLLEIEKKKLEKVVKDESSGTVDYSKLVKLEEELGLEPKEPHIWTEDATPQSLTKLICENKALGLFSAEGGSVIDGIGQYSKSKGADLRILLAGHAGDPVKTTRITGENYYCKKAILSVGISAQPIVLEDVLKDAVLVRRGFVARFAFFIPPDPRGNQIYEEKAKDLPETITHYWKSLILGLHAHRDSDEILYLTKEARLKWMSFGNEIQERIKPNGDLRFISDWASKLAGLCGRLAAIYHLSVDPADVKNPISISTLNLAISSCRKLIENFKSLSDVFELNPDVERAKLILNQIVSKKLSQVSVRDIQHNNWGGCKKAKQVRKIMKILENHNMVKSNNTKIPTKYDVHPNIMSVLSAGNEGE